MAENPAPNIPDHELLCRIGRGSYGEVWLAKSVTVAYRAVKVVYRKSFDHERPYDREFAGIKKFEPVSRSSDTQVDILHVGRNDADGFFYYVMELADDQKTGAKINPVDYTPRTLRSEIYKQGRLPLQECLEIGIQLATALEHLHGSGLVHRDIKPSNIVFVNGTPKLADVGLVTTLDATRSFVGTEGYIPLEGPGTPQADLYSLGKVLYEISTGQDRQDFPELPADLKDRPDKEALIQFNEIILKACDDDREKRYQSASEMRRDLETLKGGKPIVRAKPVSTWRKLTMFIFLIVILAAGFMMALERYQSHHSSHIRAQALTGEFAPSGLIAWWKGDGNALDSVGNHDGVIHGAVTFGSGINGQAFQFDGGCVEVADSADLRFGSGSHATLSAWAYRTSPAIPFHILGKRIGCSGGNIGIDYQLGIDRRFPETPLNEWVLWTLVNDGGWVSVYTNGVFAQHWPDFFQTNLAPFRIGASGDCNGFIGKIADVRIYNRALSVAEIQSLHKIQNQSVYFQIPKPEFNALVDLYNSTGGSKWINQSGWLDPKATAWSGIGISGVQYDTNGNVSVQGNVTSINLQQFGLTGSIPDSIGNFTRLNYLRLSFNQLTGNIPASIGNLKQLSLLYLHFNQLSGPIPDTLGFLQNLKYLYLRNNALTGRIPASLGNLARVELCGLGENQLSGEIPASLGNLPRVSNLDLNDNLLTGGIPESLGRLSTLRGLQFQHNGLSGHIPDIFASLTNLNGLRFNNNHFSGSLPASVSTLSNLQTLDFSANQLEGEIPLLKSPLNNASLSPDASRYPVGANFSGNCFDITTGSQSRSNLDLMISQGKTIVYLPNCEHK